MIVDELSVSAGEAPFRDFCDMKMVGLPFHRPPGWLTCAGKESI
jgi:hypothetical protein